MTLAFFLIPAVSVIINSFLNKLYLVSIESLVVPDISVTIFLSSPKIAFINDDLPTFGLPSIEILGKLSSWLFILSSNFSTMRSSNSPVPDPLIEEIGTIGVSLSPSS